jgi:hypothetical protein
MTNTCCTVITATTGRASLLNCMRSVADQAGPRVGKIQHMIFVDGKENYANAIMITDEFRRERGKANLTHVPEDVIFLPTAVGKDRWNGHRMYAAGTYLAAGEYIMYLDDDNTIDPFHINSCLEAIESTKGSVGWAYTLRKIVDQNGKFFCYDDCESLGPDYPTILGDKDRLVDVNCYFIHHVLAAFIAPLWYRKAREPNVMEVDRVLVKDLAKFPSIGTGKYTVNYAVDSTHLSVGSNFFMTGNAAMAQRYPGGPPWRK